MQKVHFHESLIIAHFRLFYEEVVRLKGKALSATLLKQDEKERSVSRYIFNRLVEILSHHQHEATAQEGEAARAYYDEALYVMVALADEVFLSLPWTGKEAWREHLLEVHFFNTHKAGEFFFEKLEKFLSADSAAHKDLGVLYLWSLGLGFQGALRDEGGEVTLARYKKSLRAFVVHGSKDAFVSQDSVSLCEQAYDGIVRGSLPSHIPSLQFWYRCLYGTIGLFFVISFIVWKIDINELNTLLNSTIRRSI